MLTRRAVFAGMCLATNRLNAAQMHPGVIPVINISIVTTRGTIEAMLYIGKAPESCRDFLKYIDAGQYDGGAFTRTVRPDNDHGTPKIDVIQAGIRKGQKEWAPIAFEPTSLTGLRHRDGTLSLPRDGTDTGSGGEFFICIGNQPALDHGGTRNKDGQGFAAFGQVTGGMDIVRRIWQLPASARSNDPYTAGQMLTTPVAITKIRKT